MREAKQPHKVYRAGGREFPVYPEYDEQLGESYPAYPDFEERPEYTDEGHPFATAEQESCLYAKTNSFGRVKPSDCGGCSWFCREQMPYDPIGVCMCEARRRENETKSREETE